MVRCQWANEGLTRWIGRASGEWCEWMQRWNRGAGRVVVVDEREKGRKKDGTTRQEVEGNKGPSEVDGGSGGGGSGEA